MFSRFGKITDNDNNQTTAHRGRNVCDRSVAARTGTIAEMRVPELSLTLTIISIVTG